MSITTFLAVWLVCSVLSLLWFWPNAAACPYPRWWQRWVDCTAMFVAGPIGLLANAFITAIKWDSRR